MDQAKLQLEAQKLAATAAGTADQNEIKRAKIQADMQLQGTKIGAQIKESQQKQTFDQERTGIEIGARIAKERRDLSSDKPTKPEK